MSVLWGVYFGGSGGYVDEGFYERLNVLEIWYINDNYIYFVLWVLK